MLVDVKRHFCPCIWALAAVSGSACAVVLLLFVQLLHQLLLLLVRSGGGCTAGAVC